MPESELPKDVLRVVASVMVGETTLPALARSLGLSATELARFLGQPHSPHE